MRARHVIVLVLSVIVTVMGLVLTLERMPTDEELHSQFRKQDELIWVGIKGLSSAKDRFSKVIPAYGDIFYVEAYKHSQILGFMQVFYTAKSANKLGVVEAKVKLLTSEKKELTDYQKVLWVNDYLLSTVEYAEGVTPDGLVFTYDDLKTEDVNVVNAYGALIEGRAVCQGITSAASLLLSELGITNRIRTGSIGGQAHSWNYVQMENKFYNLDITNNRQIPYAVFLSEDFSMEGYSIEDKISEGKVERFNYYFQSGSYAEDLKQLLNLIEKKGSGSYKLGPKIKDTYANIAKYLVNELGYQTIAVTGHGRVISIDLQ